MLALSYLFNVLRFEYDPTKNASNKIKHGIDFEQAQALWEAEKFVAGDAATRGEPRFFRLAKIGDRLWFALYTMRGETVRLISVRHPREIEKELYERHTE